VTLTATWLLPIALIPGTWQVYEIPTTPQITERQTAPQPEPNESDNAVSVETQEGGGPIEGTVLDEGALEPKATTSQEPDQGEAWGSSSPSHTSKHQPPQGYWNPDYSAMWTPPEHGYPNPMYSSSSSFHYVQPHHPPGAYSTPTLGYTTPTYEYYRLANSEQTPETHEPTTGEPAAPPPVVVNTVPLPSSRPNTPPRRRR